MAETGLAYNSLLVPSLTGVNANNYLGLNNQFNSTSTVGNTLQVPETVKIESPVFKTGTNISTPGNIALVDPNTGAVSGWTETLGNIGTGVSALSGLAGMYYAKKNYDLEADQAKYLKSRDAASDARSSKFASNAGNGASY